MCAIIREYRWNEINGVQGDNRVILRPWSETICGPIALRHKSASFYFYIWAETTTFFRGKIGSLFPHDHAPRSPPPRMSDKRTLRKKTTTSFTGSRATDTTTSLDGSHFLGWSTNKQTATRQYTRKMPNKFLTSYPMQTGLWPVTWREPESDRSICVQNTPYSAALPLASLPLTLSVARLLARVFLAFLLVVENLSTRIFSTFLPKIWLNENAHAPRQITRCA